MREGWTYKKLGECFPYIKNGANIKQIKGAKGYPITRIETLSGGVFNRDRMGYADIFDINKFQDYILKNGDLLMSHINSKAYIGRTVQYTSQNDEVIIHGMNLLRLKSNESVLLSSFFKFYTDSWHFKTDIASIRKDAVNQSSFAISDLKNFKVPVPSLSEQQSIVAELDIINELISLKRTQLIDLDNLAQSIFYDMFGDPIENEKGWTTQKLEELTKSEGGGTPSKSKPEYWNGDIVWVSSKDMKSTYISDSLIHITQEGVDNSPAHILPIGTILIVNRSGILKHTLPLAITTKEVTINQDIKALVVNSDKITNLYLLYCLKAFSPFLLSKVKAVTVDSIDYAIIKNLGIPLPPLSLQQEFAKRMELIEQQKAQISSTIKDLETLLALRMQYWFD